MNHDVVTWVDYARIALSFVFTVVVIRIVIILGRILERAQLDQRAREQTVLDLRKTAEELAIKTQAAVDANDKQWQALSGKIDTNIQRTEEAADASKRAEVAANGLNEKIVQTNQRLIDQGANRATQEIHEHIEQAVAVGKETLNTAVEVDKKIDALGGAVKTPILDTKTQVDKTLDHLQKIEVNTAAIEQNTASTERKVDVMQEKDDAREK